MFNMSEFLISNLIEGYKNGTFNEIQINIFAFNYLSRGQLSQDDFNFILQEIENIKNPPALEDEEIVVVE